MALSSPWSLVHVDRVHQALLCHADGGHNSGGDQEGAGPDPGLLAAPRGTWATQHLELPNLEVKPQPSEQ